MKRSGRLALSALVGIAALLISYGAIFDAQRNVDRMRNEMMERYGGELASVCVARRQIEPGEKIDEGNTVVTEWVSTLLPDGAITGLADAVGRTATARIPEHAPLAEAHFEQREGSVDVPRGMVAVSVASDPEHAVGGVLKCGEKVDVYAQGDAKADRLTSAEIIDSSVKSAGGGDVQWVTLAVHPSAVQELLAATSRGMVTLVAPGVAVEADDDTSDGEKDAAGAPGDVDGAANAEELAGSRSSEGRSTQDEALKTDSKRDGE